MTIPVDILAAAVHAAVLTVTHLMLIGGLVYESRWQKRVSLQVRSRTPVADGGDGREPLVSLVIPARNEQERLGNLLESLKRQNYADIEYIFIDDRSTDATGALLEAFARENAGARIITLAENPGPNHKQYALSKGIACAKGDFILFTDADCTLPDNWARGMRELMSDENCGIIIAPVFKKSDGGTFLARYQCIDHAVRCVYMVGTTGFGAGFCGFGNNMMLRRSALDEAGGYDSVPYSLTEDASLIAHIRTKTRYTIQAACRRDLFVVTESEHSWKAFLNQILRWSNGALFSRDFRTRLSYRYLMLSILAGLLLAPFCTRRLAFMLVSGAALLVMLLMGLCARILFGKTLPKSPLAYLGEIIAMPLVFALITIQGFAGIIPVWKDNRTFPKITIWGKKP
ncbi:MAG: glycosyltransferase [Spirochaetaceae bacterium]|jgi:cellulose synthase/poly-beta-1,6-N-acetylglucosamine synthase-like glycosyltransferase|nr:glycosyltransferase [Spirochaetaceae bacterium]